MPALKTAPLPKILDSSRLDWLLDNAVASGIEGTIWSVGRNAIEAVALPVPMGSLCEITRRGRSAIPAEVIGFSGSMTLLAPLEGSEGISPGDRVRLVETCIMIPVGPEMLGRVFDAAGRAIDDLPQPRSVGRVPLDNSPISAMQRPPITEVLTTGVRSIDALLTLGRGQRIGIFAGSGVGKSTLLGMMSRGTDADVIVIGLVGERGREVQEYLQRELDPATRQRCVTVVATSDQPALRRVQAAMAATAVAEYFRDTGKNVLLMMDSVTRFAMAQREIGLAAGEAPTTRGYPPSVFSMLPRLVERSGIGPTGSITGIYTVLVEGDDTNEPISDTLRGLLDGHFVLSRKIAHQGRYPALDVLSSLSRLQTHLVNNEHLAGCQAIRNMLSTYKENEDIITIGAYQRGSNLNVDRAIAFQPAIHQFLAQHARDVAPWKATVDSLNDLARQSQAPVQNIPPAKPANAPAAEANRTA
jgi:flagellum-specific ATP synthase